MKFKFWKVVLAGFVISVSGFANAGLIQTDYQEIGDNLTVTDTNNNLEWLSLTLTFGLSSDEVRVQYSDFRFANRVEYESLMTTHFLNFTTFDVDAYDNSPTNSNDAALITQFIALFGSTYEHSISSGSYGWLLRPDSQYLQLAGADDIALFTNFTYMYEPNYYIPLSVAGWFMVRDATNVPEPSTLAIVALSLIGLGARRFKKQS